MSQFKRYLNIINELKVNQNFKPSQVKEMINKLNKLNELLNKNFSENTYNSRIKNDNDNQFKNFIDYHFYGKYPLKINIKNVGTFKNFKKQLITSSIVRNEDDEQTLKLLDELILIEKS